VVRRKGEESRREIMETECSIEKDLHIVKGSIEDYRRLSVYHYRDCKLGPYSHIFTMNLTGSVTRDLCLVSRVPNHEARATIVAGVIVYSMPPLGLELRNVALGESPLKMSLKNRFSFINKNIRIISRVIIEPRFRSIGLAEKLVRETMNKVDVPIIEALAVMGRVCRFFERAGMTAYRGPEHKRCIKMREAFAIAGITERDRIDAAVVQEKIDKLTTDMQDFIDKQIQKFLQCYGKRRKMPPSLNRTRFVLSRLGMRPIYYIKVKSDIKAESRTQ
jgi:hypothetical protein